MTRFTFFASALVIGIATAAAQPARAQSAPSATPVAPHAMAGQAAGMAMPDAQRGMHEKMMADMKAMDAKLDALVTKMNAATGAAKVNAIAEALTALVGQHKAMHDGMMQMQREMMMQMHGPATMPMGAK